MPIFLAVTIAMFNQLSGVNAILYYLNDIFAKAGFSKVSGDLQAVIIGATNLIFTMLAMSIIDRVGRKTLLLIGSVGCTAMSRRSGVALPRQLPPEPAGVAPGRLHRLLLVLARRRHLGVYQRSFSHHASAPRGKASALLLIGS